MVYAVFYPDGSILTWSETSSLETARSVAKLYRRKLGIAFYAAVLYH